MKTIVIVCRGNIARSPFAATIAQQEFTLHELSEKFNVVSRGIQGTRVDPVPVKHQNITQYPDILANVKRLLMQLDIDMSDHVATVVSPTDVKRASVVVAMDNDIQQKLGTLFPSAKHKIRLFSELSGTSEDVVDPERVTSSTKDIFLQIRHTIISGLPTLIAMANGKY